MKKLFTLGLALFFVLTLSACVEEPEPTEFDYSDFEEHIITSYEFAASIEDERYIVYYYYKSCGACLSVKQEILGFFSTFDILPFYIMETSSATDNKVLEEPEYIPTILLMADGEILEKHVGSDEVRDFIEDYKLQVLGATRIIQQLLPRLKKSQSSSIVFFSSVPAIPNLN